MTNHYQQILQTQPWLGNWPYVLASVTPQFNQQQLWLHHDNHAIPTQLSQRECWQLLAISGGNPITVMGEWNGEYFKPLSAIDNGGLHPLHTTCLSEA